MADARIAAIATYLPAKVVTNDDLQRENPDWDVARIEAKVGINRRHIAAPEECASDLAYGAARRLLDAAVPRPEQVDVLLLCTQSPDYALPATACILQHRLELPTTCAALDINQGCSGYIYGLHLAKALIRADMARNVLFLTAETYSKYIHPRDRSVRTVFGDGACATLVTSGTGARLGLSLLGTDGSGYENLIVRRGARRDCADLAGPQRDDSGAVVRTAESLSMNGQELFAFTLRRVPQLVEDLLAASGIGKDQVDWFIFHQANAFMNEHLRRKLGIPQERAPLCLEGCGNTVSSTIPLTLHALGDRFTPRQTVMLAGFGVGYSWGACLLEWGDVTLV